MNQQEMIAKVQQLMQDDSFKAKLAEAESMDAMAALFCEEGLEVTGAELEAAAAQQSDELSEESLENVAGGGGILAAACIVFVGGSILLGYVDGVKKKAKKCGWF